MEISSLPSVRYVELTTGSEAHPETADVLLMPTHEYFSRVERNAKLNTEVRVAAGLYNRDGREWWLVGYLSSDANVETVEEERYELTRAFICERDEDPNGYYANDIYDCLLVKASEGHVASEVVDFLNDKVLVARKNLSGGLFVSTDVSTKQIH